MVINVYEEVFISLLRYAICGIEIDDTVRKKIDGDVLQYVFNLSVKHDVTNIVADALFKSNIMPAGKIANSYRSYLIASVMRYQISERKLEQICDLFEQNEVFHIPLKGSVIRNYYPEPWLRTSCDIDILIKKDFLEKASDLFEDKLSCKLQHKGSHDWHFMADDGVCIELHFDLIENEFGEDRKLLRKWNTDCLSDVWNFSSPVKGKKYRCKMSNEFFYIYHIAHMAKHFEIGGCGVRSVIDLWILNNKFEYDKTVTNDLLMRSNLMPFEQAVCDISNSWFGSNVYDDLTSLMSEYILGGGVYGSVENFVIMQQSKIGGKFKYALSRFFLPYDSLKFHYPILHKQKWLFPFCQVARWVKIVFCGGLRRSVNELKLNTLSSYDKSKSVKTLLDKLNL